MSFTFHQSLKEQAFYIFISLLLFNILHVIFREILTSFVWCVRLIVGCQKNRAAPKLDSGHLLLCFGNGFNLLSIACKVSGKTYLHQD